MVFILVCFLVSKLSSLTQLSFSLSLSLERRERVRNVDFDYLSRHALNERF